MAKSSRKASEETKRIMTQLLKMPHKPHAHVGKPRKAAKGRVRIGKSKS